MPDLRLNGINPLSYLGVNPYTPVPLILQRRDPTQNDDQNFSLGTMWMNLLTYDLWYLANLEQHVATWVLLSGGNAAIEFIEGNIGGPVGPDANSIINLLNANTTVQISGNPGTNTLTQDFGITNLMLGSDMPAITTATNNIGLGDNAGDTLTSGSNNILLGPNNGSAFAGTESSNILIGSAGVAADNNTLRIGTNGAGAGQQNAAYMAGVYQALVDTNTDEMVVIDANNKLGTTSLSALSWTPTIAFGGASVGVTYAVQEGHYQSIGNLIFFAGGIVLSNKGVSVGNVTIDGLPFTAGALNNVFLGTQALSSVTFPAGRTYAWCAVLASTTTLTIQAGGSGVAQADFTDAEFANNSAISFSGYYFTA